MSEGPPSDVDSPDLLYHYTSAEGLLGILAPNGYPGALAEGENYQANIRLSHCAFMNDPQENRALRRVVGDHFRRLLTLTQEELSRHEYQYQPDFDRLMTGLGDRALETFHRYITRLIQLTDSWPSGEAVLYGPWVFSLSEEADQLSQWRAYCPRGGYAIGFSRASLAAVRPRAGQVWLAKCSYDQPGPEAERTAVWAMRKFASDWSGGNSQEYTPEQWADMTFQMDVQWNISQLAAKYKSTGFSEEMEWRLFTNQESSDMRYGVGPWGLRPFVNLNVPLEAVKEIRVGPSNHSDLAALAAHSLERDLWRRNRRVRDGTNKTEAFVDVILSRHILRLMP